MFLAVCAAVAMGGCGRAPSKVEDAHELVRQAVEARTAGKNDEALALFNRALEIRAVPYVYFERAKLHHDLHDDQAALADCAKGLEIDPEYRDLRWYREELSKPVARQFQGAKARPPSANR